MVAGLRHALGADVLALRGRENDIDGAQSSLNSSKTRRGSFSQSCVLAKLAQELP